MVNLVRQATRNRPVVVGYVFAIAAAMSYGTTHFLARKLVSEVAPPLVTASFALLFGTLFLFLLTYRDIPMVKKAPGRAILFIILAGVFASSGVALMFSALSLEPVVTVSPIASIQPLIALALTHLFLQRLERVTLRIIVGAVLVTGGVVLIAVSNA